MCPAQDARPARRPRPSIGKDLSGPRRGPSVGTSSQRRTRPRADQGRPIASRSLGTGRRRLRSWGSARSCKALPHRYPFLADSIGSSPSSPGRRVVALKNVSYNEPFFQGHWPTRPIMPGVLIVEAMAQAAGRPDRPGGRGERPRGAAGLARRDQAAAAGRAGRPTPPGGRRRSSAKGRVIQVKAVARVGGRVVAEGEDPVHADRSVEVGTG